MEQRNDVSTLLNMMVQPGFLVEDNRITLLNPAASQLFISPGTDVRDLLATGREEYAGFSDGCLYLQLDLGGTPRGASVQAIAEGHVFLLEPETQQQELLCYALASQCLRSPMSNVMIAAEQLTRTAGERDDPALLRQLGQLNRGVHQMLRLVNNMSDALLYTDISQQELRNIPAVFEEIFDKAQTLLEQAGIRLTYQGLREELCGMADSQQLERAVLNLLDNAVRFSPAGGTVSAALTRRGGLLCLHITDSGEGIPASVLPGIFHRYLRQPGIEDGRYGLGLGMALVRTAAVNHGGTVLIDRSGKGTRITMTVALRQDPNCLLRSPVMQLDYAGGLDHQMVELSQVLPASMYES
ncbi:MAG: HAMP domain-containing sensor histidine kinase [Eubacteriales bacterium]|nr:HAMP domain-containing sensor histidine kinase [Eubacteriales bacterium]